MADWHSSMQQTFEYYTVDPGTWKDVKKIDTVKSCSISRDSETDTVESASIDIIDSLGESYIRVYLITIQNGVKEKFPLGTFLVQTPSSSFDGKVRTVSMECYSPLLELKESPPPIGYYVAKEVDTTVKNEDDTESVVKERQNVMDMVYRLTKENLRAPVVKANCPTKLFDHFVANTEDTWLSFLIDLAAYAKYTYSVDEMGRILFSPQQDTASLQPVWTFDDSNSSILYPDLNMTHDLYGIPNVVEVLYSSGNDTYYSRVVNDDPNSPTSTVSRGREIIHRVTNPSLIGDPTENRIDEYANQLLRELSTIEYQVSYTHAYCPVRVGDCVRLNYSRAGLTDVKAKVISQSIKCEPGCPVSEKAVFTTKLWR